MLSKNDETRSLALEIIEDIEMSRTSAEALVLKASRLGRLVDEEEVKTWLLFKRFGYRDDDEIAIRYLGYTNRWIDTVEHNKGAYWGPISQQEAFLEILSHQLEVIKNYRPSGEYAAGDFVNQQIK